MDAFTDFGMKLDRLFIYYVAKRGLVADHELSLVSERPLGPALIRTDWMTRSDAASILYDVAHRTLNCDKCPAVYTGEFTDGRRYACSRCGWKMDYPQRVAQEARMLLILDLTGRSDEPATPSSRTGRASVALPIAVTLLLMLAGALVGYLTTV